MNDDNKSPATFDLPGPAYHQAAPADIYENVACDFTDELEHLSVKKIAVEMVHFDSQGKVLHSLGHIIDIYIEDKAEYVKLSSGISIRLDLIKYIRSAYKPKGPQWWRLLKY